MPRIYGDTLDKKLATLERVADQYDTDIKRLWKRISQTPQNYVGGPFAAQNAQQATGTSSTTTTTTTTTTGTTGTTTTGTTGTTGTTTTGTTTTGTTTTPAATTDTTTTSTTTTPAATTDTTTTGTTTPAPAGNSTWTWTSGSPNYWKLTSETCNGTTHIPDPPSSAGTFVGEVQVVACVANASASAGYCVYYWDGSIWVEEDAGCGMSAVCDSGSLGSGSFDGQAQVKVCYYP